MARAFKCPARKRDPISVVWLEIYPGGGRRSLRPWCKECLMDGRDSVLQACDIKDFYAGSSFPLILSSLEERRHAIQAAEAARDSEARYAALEATDSARSAELEVLAGCYRGRTTQRLLGRR